MCWERLLNLIASCNSLWSHYKFMKNNMYRASNLKHIAILFCSLFALLLCVMHSADWWGLNQKSMWPSHKLLMLRMLSSALLSFFACTLIFWMREFHARARLYFLGWFALCMLIFLASWPGYLMSDSVFTLKYALEYPIELWLGFFKPFFFFSILQIFPHVSAITFIQLTIVAAIFAYATEVITLITGSKKYAIAFFLLVVINPAILFNIALLSRDTLFGMIVLWAAVFIVKLSYRNTITTPTMLLVGILLGLLIALRGDGWFVVLPFLLSFALISKKRKDLVAILMPALAIVMLFSWILPKTFAYQSDGFRYKVANTVNPIGYILQSKFHTDAGNNKAGIGAALHLDKLVAMQTPYEISYYWSEGAGAYIDAANPQVRNAYLGHVYGFFKENMGIFLAGRVETFFASTGFTSTGFNIIDMYREGWPIQPVPPESVGIDLNISRPVPMLTDALQNYLTYSAKYDPSLQSGSALFWNFLPSLAILLIAALTRFSSFGLRLAASVVITRLPIIFLAAPSSQFKYYLSVELCGAFFLVLLFASGKQHFLAKFKPKKLSR